MQSTYRTEFCAYLQARAFVKRNGTARGVIVTYCNSGYVNFTHNLLVSLRNANGLDKHCAVLCTDDLAHKALGDLGFDVFRWRGAPLPISYVSYQDRANSQWAQIMATKLDIVHAILECNLDVMYTDGDVVWLRDCLDDLIEHAYDTHNGEQRICVFMNDLLPEDKVGVKGLCAGFFYCRRGTAAQQLFDPKKIDRLRFINDQDHLRSLLESNYELERRVSLLPIRQYPNGKAWMESVNEKTQKGYTSKETAHVIHFNWTLGKFKERRIRRDKMWFV